MFFCSRVNVGVGYSRLSSFGETLLSAHKLCFTLLASGRWESLRSEPTIYERLAARVSIKRPCALENVEGVW